MDSQDQKLEVISCHSFIHFSFLTIGLLKPDFIAQGPGLELEFENLSKNALQVDGEHFKHVGGPASVRIEWRSHVNVLRYLG